MIFDSFEMQELRNRYRNVSEFDAPEIVLLDRSPYLSGESEYLERIIETVPEYTQKKWKNGLLSEDIGHHMGTWFEMMLFGWLQEKDGFVVQPEIEDGMPDITIEFDGQHMYIEAKAILIEEADRERNRQIAEVLLALKTIALPFGLSIEDLSIKARVDIPLLVSKVTAWLESTPDLQFVFEDQAQNIIVFTAMRVPEFDHVEASGPLYGVFINPASLKKPIKKKAQQHKAIRHSGFPYIIALYLDPFLQSAEEVIEAWLGKVQWTIDFNKNQVIEKHSDQSGLHFFGSEILHRSVSGTLVFKADRDEIQKRRILNARYIQNPFARVWVDPFLFPAKSSYIVLSFSMGWRLRLKA